MWIADLLAHKHFGDRRMDTSYCFTTDGKNWQGKFPSRNIAIAYAEHNNKKCIATARLLPGVKEPDQVIGVEDDSAVEVSRALDGAIKDLDAADARIRELEAEVKKLREEMKPKAAMVDAVRKPIQKKKAPGKKRG